MLPLLLQCIVNYVELFSDTHYFSGSYKHRYLLFLFYYLFLFLLLHMIQIVNNQLSIYLTKKNIECLQTLNVFERQVWFFYYKCSSYLLKGQSIYFRINNFISIQCLPMKQYIIKIKKLNNKLYYLHIVTTFCLQVLLKKLIQIYLGRKVNVLDSPVYYKNFMSYSNNGRSRIPAPRGKSRETSRQPIVGCCD